MIADNRVLGVIPARGGSKGLPQKNILPLCGKPLIAWTIEAALASEYLDRVVLSSDDDEIIRIAKEWGCDVPFRRPSHLATDETPGIEPVLHALVQLDGFDYVVVLQPTSPLRTTADIDGAVKRCVEEQAATCVSVTLTSKPPQWMYTMAERGRLVPVVPGEQDLVRRQDADPAYALNGAVYVAHTDALQRTKRLVTGGTIGYVMPTERSIDIDSRFDLLFAEFVRKQMA